MAKALNNLQRFKISILGSIGTLIIRLLMMTVRITFGGFEKIDDLRRKEGGIIYTCWHGRMLIPAYAHRNRGIAIMVSKNVDGEYISQVITRLGFKSVRGSTSRGAVEAMNQMVKMSKESRDFAITPDGPRGPKYVVQPGIIFLAQKTGRAIVPAGISVDRYWQMPSWDEFRVPKPFSRAHIFFGQPMRVGPDIDDAEAQELRSRLEDEMRRITEESDNVFKKKRKR